jgi:hypothetical protein
VISKALPITKLATPLAISNSATNLECTPLLNKKPAIYESTEKNHGIGEQRSRIIASITATPLKIL